MRKERRKGRFIMRRNYKINMLLFFIIFPLTVGAGKEGDGLGV